MESKLSKIVSSFKDPLAELRWFLRHPDEADTEQARCALLNIGELMNVDDIHYQHVPQLDMAKCDPDHIQPYVWYAQLGVERRDCLSQSSILPCKVRIIIEIWSCDAELSQVLEHEFCTALHGYTGRFGEIEVQDITVQNQDDAYAPQGLLFNTDQVLYVQSFTVEVVPLW